MSDYWELFNGNFPDGVNCRVIPYVPPKRISKDTGDVCQICKDPATIEMTIANCRSWLCDRCARRIGAGLVSLTGDEAF